jgi:hypothetical protein
LDSEPGGRWRHLRVTFPRRGANADGYVAVGVVLFPTPDR